MTDREGRADRVPERVPERAEFAPRPVPAPGRRHSVAVLGWVGVLGGAVALGIGGQREPGPPQQPVAESLQPSAITVVPRGPLLSKRFDPAYPSLVVRGASDAGRIQFEAVRSPSSIAIRGVTTAERVTRVLVTAQSLDGQLASSEATRVTRPTARDSREQAPPAFAFDLPMPARIGMRVVVVEASAYDARGNLLASARIWLEPEA